MEYTPNNIFIAVFSLITVFTIFSYIPDDHIDYQEFKRQQLKEEEEEENERQKQLQINLENEDQEQCNSSIWNRLFSWLVGPKQQEQHEQQEKPQQEKPQLQSNINNNNNGSTSYTTTTTTTITTFNVNKLEVELKAELDQETQNRNIERKGRLLAEQRLMDELTLNQSLAKKNREIEDYSQKLLNLCTFAIEKKKETQQSLSQVTEHSNTILNLISQKIQSNYSNSNSSINENQLTITLDKELLEQFDLLSKYLSEVQNRSNQLGTNSLDESVFLDLIKTTNLSQQKLPFTFADII